MIADGIVGPVAVVGVHILAGRNGQVISLSAAIVEDYVLSTGRHNVLVDVAIHLGHSIAGPGGHGIVSIRPVVDVNSGPVASVGEENSLLACAADGANVVGIVGVALSGNHIFLLHLTAQGAGVSSVAIGGAGCGSHNALAEAMGAGAHVGAPAVGAVVEHVLAIGGDGQVTGLGAAIVEDDLSHVGGDIDGVGITLHLGHGLTGPGDLAAVLPVVGVNGGPIAGVLKINLLSRRGMCMGCGNHGQHQNQCQNQTQDFAEFVCHDYTSIFILLRP